MNLWEIREVSLASVCVRALWLLWWGRSAVERALYWLHSPENSTGTLLLNSKCSDWTSCFWGKVGSLPTSKYIQNTFLLGTLDDAFHPQLDFIKAEEHWQAEMKSLVTRLLWAFSFLCRRSGVLFVTDREAGFGLASQEPWIQHASVRDNILFGKNYEAAFYQAVIEACALSDDLNVRSHHHSCWLKI